MIILFSLTYLQLCLRTFEGLNCQSINEQYRLTEQPDVICYQGNHLAIIIIICTILLPIEIAFPTLSFLVLQRAYHKDGGLTEAKRIGKYGFLYRNLKEPYYWVRLCTFVASFFLALQTSFAPDLSTRIFVAAALFLLYALIVLLLQPFDKLWRNIFYTTIGFLIPVVSVIYLAWLNLIKYVIIVVCIIGIELVIFLFLLLFNKKYGYWSSNKQYLQKNSSIESMEMQNRNGAPSLASISMTGMSSQNDSPRQKSISES